MHLKWFRSEALPAADPFLDRRTAYTCLNEDCRTVQQGAPRGVCRRCGSTQVVSIDQLLHTAREALHWRLQAQRARRLVQSSSASLAAFLTEWRQPSRAQAAADEVGRN